MVRILWIEEESKTKLLHYKALMVRAGYIVDVAESVTEAIEYFRSREYDVLIIDILLPREGRLDDLWDFDFGGMELIEIARDKYGIGTDQMMVLTVVNDRDIHDRIRELGIEKILVKGAMDIGDLKKHVDELLK